MTEKIAKLIKSTIDDIVAAFPTLDDAELAALREAEIAAANRTGMLKAIDVEQAARALLAREQSIKELAAEQGVTIFTASDIDALRVEYDERFSAMEAKLRDAEAGTVAQAVPSTVRKLAIVGMAVGPFHRIAFTGSDDMTLADLDDLEFQAGAFKLDHSRRTISLEQPIVFPIGAKRSEVTKAWLLGADGDPVSVVNFVNPIAIGGGTNARIPAGHLAFHQPETETSAAAAADGGDDDD
ncbi:hypothetical protein [uncultured Novosphingobium sp.]|uniref:hypothetical protein n=1 Tax=uncultured Novosphingobium sp. TaxID=292277 RepID=UPI0025946F9A|nr:hypothetical protein [uncultured Novosphingobium sp.]